jgi:hypothetical protein
MSAPSSASSPIPDPSGIIEVLRGRDERETFSATALAVSTEPDMTPVLTLLLRCRTMDEVKLLALTLGLRASSEGTQVVLAERRGKVVARAWLFD